MIEALTCLVNDESRVVRSLGLRLWGDFGEFSVPLMAMRERRRDDESVRRVLVRYFEEVMRRDSESIQNFADAIKEIRHMEASAMGR